MNNSEGEQQQGLTLRFFPILLLLHDNFLEDSVRAIMHKKRKIHHFLREIGWTSSCFYVWKRNMGRILFFPKRTWQKCEEMSSSPLSRTHHHLFGDHQTFPLSFLLVAEGGRAPNLQRARTRAPRVSFFFVLSVPIGHHTIAPSCLIWPTRKIQHFSLWFVNFFFFFLKCVLSKEFFKLFFLVRDKKKQIKDSSPFSLGSMGS